MKFSQSQQSVIDYNDGNLLVVAGAGSGKTRVITEKIRLTVDMLKSGEKILALTFSNKAADELRERLEANIDKSALEEKCFIGTIHNFCLDLISSKGYVIGLPADLHIFESYNDRLEILYRAINNIPSVKDNYKDESKLKELFDTLSKLKRELKFYSDYRESSNAWLILKEYDELLLSQNAIDFDDILRYSYKIFDTNDQVLKMYRRIYKYLFIDEAQDLNKAQYEVIKLLAGEDNIITMVGDQNQSIYGFNGSSSKYFTDEYKEDLNPKLIELKENYRSAKKIVESAKKIEPSFKIEGICPYDGVFEIKSFSNEFDEANWIIYKIEELQKNGHSDIENNVVALENCAVIARNRYVFNNLIELLKQKKINYTLKVSSNNSFESESNVMKVFELGLRLIANEKDSIHLEQMLNILDIKDDLKSLNDVINYLEKGFNEIIANLKDIWIEIEKTQNSGLNFKKSLEKFDVTLLSDENEKEYAIFDIDKLNTLWDVYVAKSNVSNRTLTNFIKSLSLGETQIHNDVGLTLTTVHMAKGLEFDVVFVMGLTEGTFPDYRANDDEKMLEEKHNMFVSITRAKRLCYLTYPLSKATRYGSRNQSPSRYIVELEKQ